MLKAPVPENENERIAALKAYEILDTLPEREFDDLTSLAALICGTPMALITLIDESRQWFKSRIGLEGSETPRELSFCSHTILQDDVLLIDDATRDARFSDHPFVTGDPRVRFYAGAPLISPGGLRLGAICVVDTCKRELKDYQVEALARLARQVISQMELRSRVRQLESAKRELTGAHESVVKANRAKMQFLANMSHEIRTPMTVINDVLDFSNLESHKLELDLEPFDVMVVVEDVMGLFAEQIAMKGLRVSFTLDPSVPRWLLGDASRLSQVLTNLLSNAVKFTERGSVDVKVELAGRTGADYTVRISVTDTGIGISRDVQTKLFESIVQADPSTTRRFGGSGLGLAISKALVELMRGTMTLESGLNRGSTVSFTFQAPQTRAPLKAVTACRRPNRS